MSQLLADIFDEESIEINRWKGSHTANEENLASMATPFLEVHTASSHALTSH